jgi:hypothetical protein
MQSPSAKTFDFTKKMIVNDHSPKLITDYLSSPPLFDSPPGPSKVMIKHHEKH